MENTSKMKSPGVYIPPPLFYVLTFLIAIFLQKRIPLPEGFFQTSVARILGYFFILMSLYFLWRSLRQFFLTRNTVITVKPATSLQTTGVYAITRNPMYLGLVILYIGIALLIGNWWNFLLLIILTIFLQEYLIKREERYLMDAFGAAFEAYCSKTRRWI